MLSNTRATMFDILFIRYDMDNMLPHVFARSAATLSVYENTCIESSCALLMPRAYAVDIRAAALRYAHCAALLRMLFAGSGR